MTDATALWKRITDEMMLAKKAGMTLRELTIYTDKQAKAILAAVLGAVRREAWEQAAKHLETYPNRVLYSGETIAVLDERAAWCRAQAEEFHDKHGQQCADMEGP